MKVKFIQIIAGSWESHHGTNFSLIALDENGDVWRYLVGEQRWDKYPPAYAQKKCQECGR